MEAKNINEYNLKDLGSKINFSKKIKSLLEINNEIYIKEVGLVNKDNAEVVCKAIDAMLKLDKSNSVRGEYRKRTEEEELYILNYSIEHTVEKASRLFGLAESTIKYIRKKHGVSAPKGRKKKKIH